MYNVMGGKIEEDINIFPLFRDVILHGVPYVYLKGNIGERFHATSHKYQISPSVYPLDYFLTQLIERAQSLDTVCKMVL